MAESMGSDLESDASSVDGTGGHAWSSTAAREQLAKRIDSLQQENRVLRMELEAFRYKCKSLEEENRELKKARVTIQLMAEQQEEFISNTLQKKIQSLKNEKEQLARNYEQEEEFLTNDLSRKLFQLRQEKCELEETLEKEQEYQVNKLMRRIDKLQAEVVTKQTTLEQLKKDKVELENQLEQEQEALVNRLWKRMDKLEAEKRLLQHKLDQPISGPSSPRDSPSMNVETASPDKMTGSLVQNIQVLKAEVSRLHGLLKAAQLEHKEKMVQFAEDERHIREQNLRLQRKLQMEIERREQLCRHLSESESSLEMDDERQFNEMTKYQDRVAGAMSASGRPRTVSSPIPLQQSPRPMSPGFHCGHSSLGPSSPHRNMSGLSGPHSSLSLSGTSPVMSHSLPVVAGSNFKNVEFFIKPSPPTSASALHQSAPSPMAITLDACNRPPDTDRLL